MTPTIIREQLKKAALCWQSGDADGFASLFTLDGEFIDPVSQYFGQNSIKNALAKFAQKNSNVTIKVRRILIDGNVAAIERSLKNTENSTGNCQQTDCLIVVDFRNGQISRWHEYIKSR
ncbi:MAG: nuclear transport factor 2 family protein [Xenococcaceae cyanobacterium]